MFLGTLENQRSNYFLRIKIRMTVERVQENQQKMQFCL